MVHYVRIARTNDLWKKTIEIIAQKAFKNISFVHIFYRETGVRVNSVLMAHTDIFFRGRG